MDRNLSKWVEMLLNGVDMLLNSKTVTKWVEMLPNRYKLTKWVEMFLNGLLSRSVSWNNLIDSFR